MAAAARRATKAAQTKPTESEAHQLEVLAHLHDDFRVAAKSVLQAYAGHMAREKKEAASASRRAARRLRRSARHAASGGDADREAESDDDEAESDDDRERIAKLEAIERTPRSSATAPIVASVSVEILWRFCSFARFQKDRGGPGHCPGTGGEQSRLSRGR